MTLNYLFFLGIIIPSIATLVLFVIFIYCWRKYKIRRDIMTKKHDPHGKFKEKHGVYARPPPPLPPRWIRHAHFGETPILNERDNEAYEEADNFCHESMLSDGQSKPMYNTFHDSGLSELSESHYQSEQACEQQCDQHRPYSSGSTDSEDSGFRSSRSGQYLHSAQNSNAQEIPLFRPIKSHKESCTVTVPKGNNCDRDFHDTSICADFQKNSSRHSKNRSRSTSSCQKQCRQSFDRNANICARPSSDSCIDPNHSTRHKGVSPSLIRLDPSPSHLKSDLPPSNCFMLNTSPSFKHMDRIEPPPYTFRGGSPEAIDLQQIETDVKLSNVPTISQQCRPLQITMAMVHRPHQTFEPMRQKMSYSVV